MKKKIVVLALCVVMISGCGSKIPTLSNGDEAIVTLGDDMISVNSLYDNLKENYALEALVSMVDKQILESEYSDKLEEATESAESSVTQLESYYGDDLLEAIQYYTSYTTIEAYKESLYIGYLQNLAITDYAKDQISEKEIKKYYKNDVVGDIKVSHILITSGATDDITDEEKTNAENEAKEKINEVISKLKGSKDVEATFTELAKEYSEDESTKENGGSLGYINHGTLGDSYTELEEAAYKLKDGEYSTEVITTELGYHVVLRLETKEKASLDDVRDSIIETLAETYVTENPVTNVTALQELRKEYKMEIVDTDLKSQYATYIQNSIAQYNSSDSSSSSK